MNSPSHVRRTATWVGLTGVLALIAATPAITRADDAWLDNYRPLSADRKARAVGDTVQVVIIESTQAESSAGTGSSSTTGFNVSGHADDSNFSAGLGIGGDADGNGQTSRSGTVRSVVTARVVNIDPEGNLVLEARQEVAVNDESQLVEVYGIARPLDITPDNYIPSNRLADSTIRINGTGAVADSQRRGIVFRFLKWLHIL